MCVNLNLHQLTLKCSGWRQIQRFNCWDEDMVRGVACGEVTASQRPSNITDTRRRDHLVVHDSLWPQDIGHGHTNHCLERSQQRGTLVWNEWKKEDEGYVRLESDTQTSLTVWGVVRDYLFNVFFLIYSFWTQKFGVGGGACLQCTHRSRKQQPAAFVWQRTVSTVCNDRLFLAIELEGRKGLTVPHRRLYGCDFSQRSFTGEPSFVFFQSPK